MGINNKSGFALLSVIFIMLVLSVLSVGIAVLVFSGSRAFVNEARYDKAFYISEGGKAFGVKQLSGYDDWASAMGFPATKSFGGGSFVLNTTNETRDEIQVKSTGMISYEGIIYERKTRITIKRIELGLGNYTLYSLGTITVGEDITINGDVSAYGEITLGQNSEVSGEVRPDTPPSNDPPFIETTHYDGEIATASGYPAGDEGYDSTTLSGEYFINGNVAFNNSANINITGTATIVATGTVLVSNGVNIENNLIIIAGGQITFGNGVSVADNGLWYSSNGIEVSNGAQVGIGEGTIFLTPGDIDIGNGADFSGGLLFGEGEVSIGNDADLTAGIIGTNIVIGNNSTINYAENVIEADSITGLGGSEGETYIVSEWTDVY